MQVYSVVIFLILLLIVAPDVYLYKRFLSKGIKKSTQILHWVLCAYFTISMFYIMLNINNIESATTNYHLMIFITGIGCIYFPKLFFCTCDFFSTIFVRWKKQIQTLGALLAITAFCMIIYSVIWGKYNWSKDEYTIEIESLPDSFEGYKIVQLSDFHLGSFNKSYERLEPLFDSIIGEKADLIIFTGDMVNAFPTEMDGWDTLFSRLNSKDTMLAIMGNHDYTPYFNWKGNDREEKVKLIKEGIRNLGFKLLLNQSHIIKHGGDSIAIMGIDYSSLKKDFPHHSNIKKAYDEANGTKVKIALIHDPTCIDDSIVPLKDVQLTLAGHTHSAQIGINIGNIRLSPANLKFKYCDGLYEVEAGKKILVSRGLGSVGIPARLGMTPQYSVITLKKAR